MIRPAATLACLLALSACGADVLTAEPVGGSLGPGQSAFVDDGHCPPGQVNKVTGPASLTASRTYACVPKPSAGLF